MSTLVAGPVGEPPRMPDGTAVPISPAFLTNDLMMCSGQLAFGSDGKIVDGDIETQTTICLQNLERVLAQVGLDRTAIVKTTIWLVEATDFSGFNAAYAKFFGEYRPARSTVCAQLLVPGARVEIEAIAQLPK